VEIAVSVGGEPLGVVCIDTHGRCGADTPELDWLAVEGEAAFYAGPPPWVPAVERILREAYVAGYDTKTSGEITPVDLPEGAIA
jgi:hypothetical protein